MPVSPHPFIARGPLAGRVRVPGDKSISHRAVIFAALAVGESRLRGLLDAEDVMVTVGAMRAMGASVVRDGDDWIVRGVGVGGLLQPMGALDMGNSGTSARLLMGLVASHALDVTFIGDDSLTRRPMERVAVPLRLMGAEVVTAPGGTLPAHVRGLCPSVPLRYRLPVPSAQLKSALLLAALNTPGVTHIIEPVPARDHSERLLQAFGADIEIDNVDGERVIAIRGERDLRPLDMTVAGDPSSAAFLALAAILVPGSRIVIENVCVNPTRIGFYTMLQAMGANIVIGSARNCSGEPVADISVAAGPLRGIVTPAAIVPDMIDEFPALFVAAAFAGGRTVARGLGELRVKESDRIAAMADALRAMGATVEELDDGLSIDGTGGQPLTGGATIDPRGDHRIAMSLAVAGLHSTHGVTIADIGAVATSFPDFITTLEDVRA